MFPGLAEKLSSLKTVVVKQSDGDFTFDWNGKGWSFRDRQNYPADGEKLNGIVLTLARMVKIESKTSVVDKYDRLDLNDPKAKDSRAKEIVLLDRDGKALADVIIGKRKFTLGGKEGGTYVRLPESPQTWLALGDINPGAKARDWLKRDIADLKDKQIKRIVVTHPDGERIVVGKLTAQDASFKVENLPKGKEPASDYVADEFGRLLAVLLLDDVAKADTVAFAKDKTITADVDGFDGIHVNLQVTESGGNTWLKIKADAPPSKEATTTAEPGADWAKMAAEITARGDGWVFQVPAYEVAPLKKRMAELIKKPEKEPKS